MRTFLKHYRGGLFRGWNADCEAKGWPFAKITPHSRRVRLRQAFRETWYDFRVRLAWRIMPEGAEYEGRDFG